MLLNFQIFGSFLGIMIIDIEFNFIVVIEHILYDFNPFKFFF